MPTTDAHALVAFASSGSSPPMTRETIAPERWIFEAADALFRYGTSIEEVHRSFVYLIADGTVTDDELRRYIYEAFTWRSERDPSLRSDVTGIVCPAHRPHLKPFVDEARNEERWLDWLLIFDREDRMRAVASVVGVVDSDTLAQMFASAWTDSDHNVWRDSRIHVKLWKHIDPSLVMNAEERNWLAELPDRVTVYRGCQTGHEMGRSWTTDRERAEFFMSYRPCGARMSLVSAVVPKDAVFMVCLGRSESEVVIRDLVRLTDLHEIDATPSSASLRTRVDRLRRAASPQGITVSKRGDMLGLRGKNGKRLGADYMTLPVAEHLVLSIDRRPVEIRMTGVSL